MTSIVRNQTLTVASGATVSSVFSASGFSSFGMILPSTFDGTSVAFEVASEVGSTTFTTLYSAANTAVAMTVAASRAYPLPSELTSFPAFRLITAAQSTTSTLITVLGKSQ